MSRSATARGDPLRPGQEPALPGSSRLRAGRAEEPQNSQGQNAGAITPGAISKIKNSGRPQNRQRPTIRPTATPATSDPQATTAAMATLLMTLVPTSVS